MTDWSISSSVPGFPAPTRQDILFEGLANLDGSGNYTGPWFDTSGINKIQVVANYGPLDEPLTSLTIEEAMTGDGVNPVNLRAQSCTGNPGYGEFVPAARFVRVVASGGSVDADGEFYMTVRGT